MWTETLGPKLRQFLQTASDRIVLVCPFIQKEALHFLLEHSTADTITIITRWEKNDIESGASDVRIYAYLKKRHASLRIHQRLHLKLFVADNRFVMSTANISSRGLGLQSPSNVECAHEPEELESDADALIRRLFEQSTPVTDRIYEKILEGVDIDTSRSAGLSERLLADHNNIFTLSSLPLTRTPSELLRARWPTPQNNLRVEVASAAALRDFCLFDPDLTQSESDIRTQLRRAFLSTPLVSVFQQFIQHPRYFGEVKQWLQEVCTDRPPPSRRTLTPYVQALYGWLKECCPGCRISRLRYSERIQMDCTPPANRSSADHSQASPVPNYEPASARSKGHLRTLPFALSEIAV